FFGDNVLSDPGMNSCHGHDHRLLGKVHLPAYDGLQGVDELCRHYDRVDAHPWRCAMRLSAFYFDRERVGRRHQSALHVTDSTEPADRLNVHAENDIHLGIVEYAFPDHQVSATFFARRRALFCGLKNKLNGPSKLISIT